MKLQVACMLTCQPLIKAFKDRLDQETLFIDTTDDRDVRRLLDVAVSA